MPFVGGPGTRITNLIWRTAAILEKNEENRYISAAVRAILTKFCLETYFGSLDRLDR